MQSCFLPFKSFRLYFALSFFVCLYRIPPIRNEDVKMSYTTETFKEFFHREKIEIDLKPPLYLIIV